MAFKQRYFYIRIFHHFTITSVSVDSRLSAIRAGGFGRKVLLKLSAQLK